MASLASTLGRRIGRRLIARSWPLQHVSRGFSSAAEELSVAFVGLGNMGMQMALNLATNRPDGDDLPPLRMTVHDVQKDNVARFVKSFEEREADGLTSLSTASDLASIGGADPDFVITSLPTCEASEAVVGGVAQNLDQQTDRGCLFEARAAGEEAAVERVRALLSEFQIGVRITSQYDAILAALHRNDVRGDEEKAAHFLALAAVSAAEAEAQAYGGQSPDGAEEVVHASNAGSKKSGEEALLRKEAAVAEDVGSAPARIGEVAAVGSDDGNPLDRKPSWKSPDRDGARGGSVGGTTTSPQASRGSTSARRKALSTSSSVRGTNSNVGRATSGNGGRATKEAPIAARTAARGAAPRTARTAAPPATPIAAPPAPIAASSAGLKLPPKLRKSSRRKKAKPAPQKCPPKTEPPEVPHVQQWQHQDPPPGLLGWNQGGTGAPDDYKDPRYCPAFQYCWEGVLIFMELASQYPNYTKSTRTGHPPGKAHFSIPYFPWNVDPSAAGLRDGRIDGANSSDGSISIDGANSNDGGVSIYVTNYPSSQQAASLDARGLSTFAGRRSDGTLIESTMQFLEESSPNGAFQDGIKVDWWFCAYPAYDKRGVLSVWDKKTAALLQASYFKNVLCRIQHVAAPGSILLVGGEVAKEYHQHFVPGSVSLARFLKNVADGKDPKVSGNQTHPAGVYKIGFEAGMEKKCTNVDVVSTRHHRNRGFLDFTCTYGKGRYEKDAALYKLVDAAAAKGRKLGGDTAGKMRSDAAHHYALCTVAERMSREEALRSVEDCVGKEERRLLEGSMEGGETSGSMRTEAALFAADRRAEGLSEADALEAVKKLSAEHHSLYEGSMKGGKIGGKIGGRTTGEMKQDARDYFAVCKLLGMSDAKALESIGRNLSPTHANLWDKAWLQTIGKWNAGRKQAIADDRAGITLTGTKRMLADAYNSGIGKQNRDAKSAKVKKAKGGKLTGGEQAALGVQKAAGFGATITNALKMKDKILVRAPCLHCKRGGASSGYATATLESFFPRGEKRTTPKTCSNGSSCLGSPKGRHYKWGLTEADGCEVLGVFCCVKGDRKARDDLKNLGEDKCLCLECSPNDERSNVHSQALRLCKKP
ncbi:hypothetical protein ACHAXT_005804 [Thalassiosira profunda]